MAMGAISTEEEYWRAKLLGQARTEAESVRYHVNVKAVQVALLMAHYEFATGHPNLAYLSLGSAVTKAFAAGIHKAGRGSDRPEVSRTMWNLFCNESISCLMLGRPYLLSRDIITVPLPETPSFVASLVRLCMTIRHTHQLYFDDKTSTISNMVDSANEILRELQAFSASVKEDIGVHIGASTCPASGEKLAWHVVTNYLYFYTQILAFRPLLLLHIELHRGPDAANHPHTTTTPALLHARSHAIEAARSIIAFAETLLSTPSAPNIQARNHPPPHPTPSPHALTPSVCQGLCNHGYFLESACFVLVLAAATHDRGGTPASDRGMAAAKKSHVQHVARGLAALRGLVQREPIPSVVAALERMLGKLAECAGNVQGNRQSATPAAAPAEQGDAVVVDLQADGPTAEAAATTTLQMGGDGDVEMLPDDVLGEQGGGGVWEGGDQGVLAAGQDGGRGGVLEDFELPNMDWGIDFSLLDVEEFVSVMGIQPGLNTFH
ncbi:putative c6 zinc finger domain protein [Diplodia seriata]|uniref:Putative c6 zinc finger domain protein n=1 Tax=Diplodia seriata TaxID=420778 RepID=A0A0G2DRW6_9PEZI|nr:putative c6 zinc finger domain protein [Diplodia seriata]